MTNGASRWLVWIAAAALVAMAVVYVVSLVLEDEAERGPVAPDSEREVAHAPAPGSTMQASQSTGAEPRTGTRTSIRRLKTEEQRRKLVEAIEIARSLRRRSARDEAARDDREPGAEDDPGSLSKDTIRDAIDAVIEDVKICYEDQLERTPDLGGKLVVSFEIIAEEGVGGVVDHAEIGDESDSAISASLELSECIVDTIYTLELPTPRGGGVVKVSYPFMMKPSAAPER